MYCDFIYSDVVFINIEIFKSHLQSETDRYDNNNFIHENINETDYNLLHYNDHIL